MSTKRIALIHALAHSVEPVNAALAAQWPEAARMNLLDDSLSADLARGGRGLDQAMHERFDRLARYALDCGSDAILFTCSAFGPCIDAVTRALDPLPVLKPNEAMVAEAVAMRQRIGLVATFAPTLQSMPDEFPASAALDCVLAEGALEALDAGDGERHDALIAQAAAGLAARGCGVIALAQFSMTRARVAAERGSGRPVLTTVDSAVRELRRRLQA